MNQDKKELIYCYGNYNNEITFFSKDFLSYFNSNSIEKLQKRILNLDPNLLSLEIDNFILDIYPLPDNNFILILNDQQNKKLKEITHDLNNLFNNINNTLTLLKKRNLDDYFGRLVNGIEENIKRANYLLHKLTINEDEEINLIDYVDINKILRLVLSEIKKISNKILFIEKLNASNSVVLANEDELYRAFYNICLNAKEAIKDSGTIKVTSINNTNSLIINIEDTGEGISEDNLTKIFDFGFSTKTKKTESGIGLSIVKNIIEKYKGSIDVKSQVGKGTTFIITFPIIIKNISPAQKSNKILLADDDEYMLDLLTELFSSYDYEVKAVKSGEELLETVKLEQDFALLIIDQNMPGIKGLDAIKNLRESGNSSAIILCSGIAPENKLEIMQKYNIAEVIIKPYNFDNLLETVKKLI